MLNVRKLVLFCCFCVSAAIVAQEQEPKIQNLETHSIAELAEGYCADPRFTDEERMAIVDLSEEDAVACMGKNWVYGDTDLYHPTALGDLYIDANVTINRIKVTDRTGKVHTKLTSPGLPDSPTATGTYTGPFRTEDGSYTVQSEDKDYFGAPMPWAIFYKHKTGYAIHGTKAVSELGGPASHGCLRVQTTFAKFLNEQVNLANDGSVTIRVHGKVAENQPKKAPKPRPRIPAPTPRRRELERNYDDDLYRQPYYPPVPRQPPGFFEGWGLL